jgi:hypothetical protein
LPRDPFDDASLKRILGDARRALNGETTNCAIRGVSAIQGGWNGCARIANDA